MPAVTASPVLTQGASGTPGSTAAAAAAAAAAIMQNGAANGPIGSCAVTVVPSTPGIQQVRSNEYIFSKSHFIEVSHMAVKYTIKFIHIIDDSYMSKNIAFLVFYLSVTKEVTFAFRRKSALCCQPYTQDKLRGFYTTSSSF